MRTRGLHKYFLLPIAAGAAILCGQCPAFAAGEELTPSLSVGDQNNSGSHASESSDDSKSFLREWTFENSFDKAGDATQSFEKAIPGKINYNCAQYNEPFEMNGKKYAASPSVVRECQRRQQAANHFKAEAAGIKKEQRIFAEVSRVSDVAAVAAIGAAAYAELGEKKNNQASTYQSAANLQEKAAIAAYTTGAADMSMAAWAYAQQKRKLEKMQETLNGKNSGVSGSSGDASLNTKLTKAIEQTKQAAINHAMYGAGKVAAGYAGMKLAQRSREQAAAMESLDATKYYLANLPLPAAASTVSAPAGGGGTPGSFTPNQPNFSLATAGETKAASTVAPTPGGSMDSSGSSSMFNSDFKGGKVSSPATSGGGETPVLVGTGGPAEMAKEEADAEEAAIQEAVAKTAFGFGEFSRGGAGSTFSGGGSKDADGNEDIPAAPGIAPGATDPGRSIASAINPNQMFEEATLGIEGNEQGSMVGVSGNRNRTLFDTIKVKHTKALQVGNLQGPGAIEVKN